MSFLDTPTEEIREGEDSLEIAGVKIPASVVNSTLNDPDYLKDGEFEFKDNGADVLFVAHLDTVQNPKPRPVGYNPTLREIHHPCLDNRLGLLAVRALVPKVFTQPYDILFTTGEESGKSTAKDFVKKHADILKRYKVAINFDRGYDSPALYGALLDKEWKKAVAALGWKPERGIFSDTTILADAGLRIANLPCGMRDYHSKKAWAGLAELEDSLGKLTSLVEAARTTPECEREKETTYTYGGYTGSYAGYTGSYAGYNGSRSIRGSYTFRRSLDEALRELKTAVLFIGNSDDAKITDEPWATLLKYRDGFADLYKHILPLTVGANESRCTNCGAVAHNASMTKGLCWSCKDKVQTRPAARMECEACGVKSKSLYAAGGMLVCCNCYEANTKHGVGF